MSVGLLCSSVGIVPSCAKARCITCDGEQCHWTARSLRRISSSGVSHTLTCLSPCWRLLSRQRFTRLSVGICPSPHPELLLPYRAPTVTWGLQRVQLGLCSIRAMAGFSRHCTWNGILHTGRGVVRHCGQCPLTGRLLADRNEERILRVGSQR